MSLTFVGREVRVIVCLECYGTVKVLDLLDGITVCNDCGATEGPTEELSLEEYDKKYEPNLIAASIFRYPSNGG